MGKGSFMFIFFFVSVVFFVGGVFLLFMVLNLVGAVLVVGGVVSGYYWLDCGVRVMVVGNVVGFIMVGVMDMYFVLGVSYVMGVMVGCGSFFLISMFSDVLFNNFWMFKIKFFS